MPYNSSAAWNRHIKVKKMMWRYILTMLFRSWFGFSALSIVGGLAFLIVDADDPLRSDDPYLAGFLCGGFSAVMGVTYSIAERACANRRRAFLWYGAIVGLWPLLLVVFSWGSREGADVGRFIAAAHLLTGIVSWLLFACRIPRIIVALVSAAGLAAVVMYSMVAAR